MIKLNIRGDCWKVYVWDNDFYVKKFKEVDSCAMVNFEDRHVYINKDDCSLVTIRHELFHIYQSYCYLKSTTELTLEDIEEVNAEMYAFEGDKISKQAKYLYKLLQDQ